jgi:GNAT superfamily N-acetyltransferase
LVIDRTSERLVELRPSWPIADVNVVARIRARPERVDAMIKETRALVAAHHVACQWFIDRNTEPGDLADHLAAYGIDRDPEPIALAMVMASDASLPQLDPHIEIRDALASFDDYAAAQTIQQEAFGRAPAEPASPEQWERARQDPTVIHLLALYDGVPAGAVNAVTGPDGWMLAGGATRESLRGRGVFRALVRERRQRAAAAGAPGVAVHAGHMSAPILSRLGFETVGELSVYRDEGTATSFG